MRDDDDDDDEPARKQRGQGRHQQGALRKTRRPDIRGGQGRTTCLEHGEQTAAIAHPTSSNSPPAGHRQPPAASRVARPGFTVGPSLDCPAL